jgi:hypothetical protein
MAETDPEYMTNVIVTVRGADSLNEICSMLRGLLYANGQSSGQTTKNREFRDGAVIAFGAAPMARKFIGSVEALFSKSVLLRITLEIKG